MTTDLQPLRDGKHAITPAQLAEKINEKVRRNKKKGHPASNPLTGSKLRSREAELVALRIISFCEERREDWKPLTLVNTHEVMCRGKCDCIQTLQDKCWLLREGENYGESLFYFTPTFINTCNEILSK